MTRVTKVLLKDGRWYRVKEATFITDSPESPGWFGSEQSATWTDDETGEICCCPLNSILALRYEGLQPAEEAPAVSEERLPGEREIGETAASLEEELDGT